MSDARLQALRESGIKDTSDLLYFFPRRYIDRSTVLPIASLHELSGSVTIIARVIQITEHGFGRKKRLQATLSDGTGTMHAVWFKGLRYFKNRIRTGKLISLFGTPKRFSGSFSITHPDIEDIDEGDGGGRGIVPVYPSTSFLKNTYVTSLVIQKWVREIMATKSFPEYLPSSLMQRMMIPDRATALRYIHTPDDLRQPDAGQRRFKMEELLLFQLSMHRLRADRETKAPGILMQAGSHTKAFTQTLPFKLTGGQQSALQDIFADLISGQQMNRLIQGDVGSGKTIVAILSMLASADSGYQSALMAPTEILAEQHYKTISAYLEPLGLTVRLLTGNQSTALRRDILTDVEGGRAHIVIGTHALIQDNVRFHKLGLAVIDEQHRFGVMQRTNLLGKGQNPHVLVMSATPIPRSLALTIYSDLDVSLIKGLPAGRKPVSTVVRYDRNREDIYRFLNEEIERGGQAYIIYPLVQESEAMDLKDATMGYHQLCELFPNRTVSLVHGKMKSDEKEKAMRSFASGDTDILVSTTVVEVGVNVPNASVMIVEHAERFGLSQLHQLRGRIGRGTRKSYCILMTDVKRSSDARVRLDTMVRTSDGFEIAEADLKLRGPGDFLGTKQSGLPDFRFADIVNDQMMVAETRNLAMEILRNDSGLSNPENQGLRKVFERYFKAKARFFSMG